MRCAGQRKGEMMITVKVIGDGGAFDTDKVNSSFLINGEILYDCGYSVFAELKRGDDKEVIKNIKTVIISHMDDDHMGSLKTLLFYRYFSLGESTVVICNEEVARYLEGINSEVKGSRKVHAQIATIRGVYNIGDELHRKHGIMAKPFFGNHHVPVFGVIFYSENAVLAISGDTKASSEFEDMIVAIHDSYAISYDNSLIFHDFSYWDAPSRQVHACYSDYNVEYSSEFRKNAIRYHNSKCSIAGNLYRLSETGKPLLLVENTPEGS